jgi:hypothetical protein
MTITTIRLTCGDCKHVFDGETVVDCPVDLAMASMRAIRCPKCGSSKCRMGGNHHDAPPVTAPLRERMSWWKERGEHGISSETIYSAFAGGQPRYMNVPVDPDDFRRCKLLLDLIPEWRADLGKVSARYPWFAPMIAQWDEIERLYNLEVASGQAPKCYALMEKLGKKCDALRKVA